MPVILIQHLLGTFCPGRHLMQVKAHLERATRRLLKRELAKHIGPVLGGAFPFGGRRCDRLAEIVLDQLGLG